MTADGPLDRLALAAAAATTGAWPRQPDLRRKTYTVRNGKKFHLRTYDGHSDDWFFGVNESCWRPQDYFVFACGRQNAMFVVPVGDLPDLDEFPSRGNDRLVHIELDWGSWVIRDPDPSFPLDGFRDAFHLLA